MTTLLTISYRGDFPWLPYLLRSVGKYVTGFDEFVIAVPRQDKHLLDQFGLTKEKVVTIDESGFKSPFHAHQFWMMNADQLCSGDYITNIDSDCLVIAPMTPETYITPDGKCINLCTRYGPTCDSPWAPGTANMLGRSVEWETMRRHGITLPKDLYAKLRQRVMDVHNKTLAEIMQPMGRAANCSEFNILGAFGYYFMPDRFRWIDTDTEPVPPNPIYQSWSHLIRVGEFQGDLVAHLKSLAVSGHPEFSKTAEATLNHIQSL
jgi:hypothetical protein